MRISLNCKICGEKIQKKNFNLVNFPDISVIKCLNCKTEMLYPAPSPKELEAIYDKTYFDIWGLSEEKVDPKLSAQKRLTYQKRLALLKKYSQLENILDVGCATGAFLQVAKSQGVKPYGIEYSKWAGKEAQKKIGKKNIFIGDIENEPFAKESFDAVAIFDVLEHIRDPISILRKVYELLRPGGILIISIPDLSSITRKFMNKYWLHYRRDHIFYFTRFSLNLAAEKNNLQKLFLNRSKKFVSLDYLSRNALAQSRSFLIIILKILKLLLPKRYWVKNWQISLGEILVLYKKSAVTNSHR